MGHSLLSKLLSNLIIKPIMKLIIIIKKRTVKFRDDKSIYMAFFVPVPDYVIHTRRVIFLYVILIFDG